MSIAIAHPAYFVYRQIMNAEAIPDVLVSRIAIAIGEPARTRMLLSLMDGRSRTSTELATLAEVTPSTASVHLNRLKEDKLVRVSAQGRHRYYSLESRIVARALENLSVLAGTKGKTFTPSTPDPLRKARTCYDHIAGEFAVALHDKFLREGWLIPNTRNGRNVYDVSNSGIAKLESLEIDIAELQTLRRRFAYACLDWSERRPHIAGALGAALLNHTLKRKWVSRDLNSRALSVTRFGECELVQKLGIRL